MGDLPVGAPVPDWRPPEPPSLEGLVGQHCRLVPVDPERDGPRLWPALRDERLWTYLPWAAPTDVAELIQRLESYATAERQGVVIEVEGRAGGVASYLRIHPKAGSIEVGGIVFGPGLAATTAATEAMFLMADRAFATGYRRYEWKCDSLNAASRRAAERLGFTFEGIFRQALVVKGRNRDTAWYSLLDREWPDRRRALVAWLDPSNYDASGRQRRSLAELRAEVAGRAGAEAHPKK